MHANESDVSPFGAKYQPKPPCVTQSKTKRTNKIVFLLRKRHLKAVVTDFV